MDDDKNFIDPRSNPHVDVELLERFRAERDALEKIGFRLPSSGFNLSPPLGGRRRQPSRS